MSTLRLSYPLLSLGALSLLPVTAPPAHASDGIRRVRVECGDIRGLTRAMHDANRHSGPTRITLGSPADDECLFPFTEPAHGYRGEPRALPPVLAPITLRSDSAENALLSRVSFAEFGILRVGQRGRLVLRDVTVSDGVAERGGGVRVDGGTLVVRGDSRLTGNLALHPATRERGDGGAIANLGGRVRIRGTASIVDNEARGTGGGVYSEDGLLWVGGSALIARNTADEPDGGPGRGAGIANLGGTLRLTGRAAVLANLASAREFGGGVLSGRGRRTRADREVLKRSAERGGEGGGIYNAGGATLSATVTIAGNGPNDCAGPHPVAGCTPLD